MKNFIAIGVSTITAIIIITIYHFFIVKKQVYIDLVKIYQEYDMSEALNQDLIDFQKDRKSELDSAYLSLSGKGNENDLRANLERQYYNLEKEISERDNRNQQLLAQKINENVKKFSAENNYQMIFGATGSGSILFADESLDITDEFLHFINTQYHDE